MPARYSRQGDNVKSEQEWWLLPSAEGRGDAPPPFRKPSTAANPVLLCIRSETARGPVGRSLIVFVSHSRLNSGALVAFGIAAGHSLNSDKL